MVDLLDMSDAALLRALVALEAEARRRRLIDTKGAADAAPVLPTGRKP